MAGSKRQRRCRWLNPIGRTTTSDAVGDLAGDRGLDLAFRPGLACGKLASAQNMIVVPRMIVPARFRKIIASLAKADDDVLHRRHLILRQLHHEAAAAALGHRSAKHQRGKKRPGHAGDVEAEHHQALQADARTRRCGRE